MGWRVVKASKRKRSESIKFVFTDPKPSDLIMSKRQAELVNVAKFWDDLLLGVKGLSSLVIAGSPRNLFK